MLAVVDLHVWPKKCALPRVHSYEVLLASSSASAP
jgi:hypothetical protein